ncbi:VWA domain-containing protein [Streptomyces sp. NPDC089919]|uniref:VWA domain-containing protein n=1 Tax=Streptomyces sp. NPDC089919 TaxID=3155188 RepID=UPI0034449E65
MSQGTPAVLYLPYPGEADGLSRSRVSLAEEWEIQQLAAARGFVLSAPSARDAEFLDTLLEASPDAALLVHYGAPDRRTLEVALLGPLVLEALLALGATLRLCGAEPVPSHRPDPRSDGTAVLLTDGHPEARRQCHAYARSCGLVTIQVIEDRAAREQFLSEQRDLPEGAPVPTVIVHPDALPGAGPDGRAGSGSVGSWLARGRTVYSTGRLPNRRPSDGAPLSAQRRLDAEDASPPTGHADSSAASEEEHDDLDLAARQVQDDTDALFSLERFRVKSSRSVGQSPSLPSSASSPSRQLAYRPAPARPLPHDGLYIRRSTAFGTRSTVGLSELIDSGVLIEQEQIRFDDFVAARTGQVPGPEAGEGLAVSHGFAPAADGAKAHDRTTHFLEIALKAGEEPPAGTPGPDPLPVNFVFAVDTSESMGWHGKLDMVKSALQEIYDRLRPTDSLGIVSFAHRVSTVLQGTTKADLPPERFAAVIGSLTAEGGTDLNLGLQYGIAEISRRAHRGRTVNRLYVFSDGNPNSGVRDWISIRKNVADQLRGDLTLSCFGFGTDANMSELSALAGTAGGHCTFVTRPEQVRTGLLTDLARRDHLAAIDIQLRIDIDPAVTVWHLYGHDLVSDPRARKRIFEQAREAARLARDEYGTQALPDLITDEKGIRIFAPDLAFGETYWVVLELQVPEGADVGSATVQYVDAVARAARSSKLALAEAPDLSAETVTVHAVGLRTSEVTFHALDDLYENDRPRARRRLSRHVDYLTAAHQAVPAPEFVDDRVTIGKLIALAGALGETSSISDHIETAAPAAFVMNGFARVRSGYAAF